ncbi:hypothetical protein JTB14_033542 [Gonioctena quinquepunctata]|nr:hypothetical protein JTB14_033542 [Gonioctena quinquepunctata]
MGIQSIFQYYIIPAVLHFHLAAVATYCLLIYQSDIAQGNIKPASFAYALMIANSLSVLSQYVPDDSFYELRVLLDYAQLLLALPFITTDFLIRYEVFPEEISAIPIFIGFGALVLFIVFEFKRQDLTDLTVILSLFLYSVSGLVHQMWAFAAAFFFFIGYFGFYRNQGDCWRNDGRYNLCMSMFAFLSLAAFQPDKLFTIPPSVEKFFSDLSLQ